MRRCSQITPLLLAPLLAVLAPSTLLWAQSHLSGESAPPETRQQLLRRSREAKAERLEPYAISRAEEWVQFLEEWRLPHRLFAKGIGGFRPVLGGMPSGSGFVVGGGYITGYNSDLAQFTANARFSTRGYQTFDAGLLLFPRANSLLPVDGYVRTGGCDLTSLRFFGLGPASGRGDRTTYRLQDRNIETGITGWAGRFGEFSGRVQWLTTETGAGRTEVSLDTRFDPTTIPGFGAEINHLVYGGRAVVHLRDSTVSPSVGVTLAVDATRYDDRDSDRYGLTRVVGDVQALIPLGYRNRILALHARTHVTFGRRARGHRAVRPHGDAGGGANTIRGFREYRFRDTRNLLLNVEYRWEAWTYLDVAVFYDAGKVFSEAADLDLRNLKSGYGFGFRAHSPTGMVMRFDFSRSNEGFILHLGSGPSF